MLEDKDLVSIQEVRTKVEKAYAAWQKYRTYSQEQVDAIVERMAAAAAPMPNVWPLWRWKRPATAMSKTRSPKIC